MADRSDATEVRRNNGADHSDTLAFDLKRARYRWQAILYVCVILVLAGAAIGTGELNAVSVFFAGLLLLHAAGLASVLKILSLHDPVLAIDRRGIFDKRVTRSVVPWAKINRVELLPMYWSSIRVDVGNRRHAGIELVSWTYLGAFRTGTVAWDDVVINPQGLAVYPHPGNQVLAMQIVTHAEALRVRYGSAGAASAPLT